MNNRIGNSINNSIDFSMIAAMNVVFLHLLIDFETIFDEQTIVAANRNHTPRLVCSETHGFSKSIAVAAVRMPGRSLREQQQYT